MIDDLETNVLKGETTDSTSDKFPLKNLNIGINNNFNILSISASKKNIYIVTNNSELICIDNGTLKAQQAYSITSNDTKSPKLNESYTKIWTDRGGNHNIIRYQGRIFYFNSSFSQIKEMEQLKSIDISIVSFDDRNDEVENTGYFLIVDFENCIFQCNIHIDKIESKNDYKIKCMVEKLTAMNFRDWDNEDENNEQVEKKLVNDRIYDIKFMRVVKEKNDSNDNECYIIAITKNRLYQFIGPGSQSFKQIFNRYNNEPSLFNKSCKYFPKVIKHRNAKNETYLDIIYKNVDILVDKNKSRKIEIFDQFGWKTEAGYCFEKFFYPDNNINKGKEIGLPIEQNNFIVIPYEKISKIGIKETGIPISAIHTLNHIFILYKDCITVISKLTKNIVHTQYFQIEFEQMIFNEFAQGNGNILLITKNDLFQISLKEENKDIWKDYLEIGDFQNAQLFCGSNEIRKRINRIEGELLYKNNKGGQAVSEKFAESDEKFEVVCLKFLMKKNYENLYNYIKKYIDNYKTDKKDEKNEYKLQLNLICTWLVEIYINFVEAKELGPFRQMIRENKKYLDQDIIYQLLQNYGRIDELIVFASIMGDYEKVISYYINQDEVDMALNKLTEFASFADSNIIKKLTKIFLDNCNLFFKRNPKESISLIKQRLKDVKMGQIVQAIMSTTDKNKNMTNKELAKDKENTKAILDYLRYLTNEKHKVEEENNIHNLYIYYLSTNQANKEAVLEYLKGPLKLEESRNGNEILKKNFKKKEVLFQLDYAKKLFKGNPPAYALVLALMGKFAEGVKIALSQNNSEGQKIARFIASNAPNEKLKKKLWIDIFKSNSKNEFSKALDIMKESKILKIEDVLPHITDTIKIEDFKKQISDCINDYEKNIKKLKDDINAYNKTAENIKNDIYRVKKKSMEIPYSKCKCDICDSFIKDKNIFLFPCGHMFDMNCIKNYLLDYEATGLDYVHKKNLKIDEIFFQLGYIKERAFKIAKKKKGEKDEGEEEEKKQEEQEKGGFFKKIKKFDFTSGFKKQEVQEEKNPTQIIILKKELNEILSEQCVLCGDFLLDSVQFSLAQKESLDTDKDGYKLKLAREPDFDF